MIPAQYHATVVVTSDTCFIDPSKDQSGQYVVDRLKSQGFDVTKKIVEDEMIAITDCVRSSLIIPGNVLTITVGGTGLCPRDVTPEATSVLYEKACHGISVALHMSSLRYSAHAALSRLTAGITGNCLIINFPGKLKACKECFACLEGFLSHALEQVNFDPDAVDLTHKKQAVATATAEGSSSTCLPDIKFNTSELVNFDDLSGLPSPVNPDFASSAHEQFPKIKQDPIEKTLQQNIPYLEIISELPATKQMSNTIPYPMIEYNQALDLMDTLSSTINFKEVEVNLSSINDAYTVLGDTVCSDFHSRSLIPPFPVSTMDGYVVNIPSVLRNFITSIKTIQASLVDSLEDFVKARDEPSLKNNFFCYQVNTGGRVPEDNFAVVPVESTGPVTTKNTVPIFEIKLGRYVREPGSDVNYTDFLKAGTVIGPVELSLILSMGHKSLKVLKKPLIGILSTGDELVEFGTDTENNEVIDTNAPLLHSFFAKNGYPVVSFGISKDNPKDVLTKVHSSLMNCDILIVTGGASMGSKDHIKDVITQIGGIIHFGRVNIKPGKPAGLASLMIGERRKFIFTLPGNPVSAYITSIVLVMPFIKQGMRKHLGYDSPLTLSDVGQLIIVEVEAILDGEIAQSSYESDGRYEFVRAKLLESSDGILCPMNKVTISIKQQSSRMLSLRDCDCLVMIKPSLERSLLLVGQTYSALKLN